MKETLNTRLAKIVLLLVTVSVCSYAQGTAADYERAGGLKAKYEAADRPQGPVRVSCC